MTMGGDCIYLYCITVKPPIFEAGSGLRHVKSAGLYATVGKVPASEFGQGQLERKLNDLEWLKQQVERHEQVIEGVMRNSQVIPSKFATVFFSERNVQLFLEQYGGKLLEKLNSLEGREEWGVKIYCDKTALNRHVVKNNREIVALDCEINSASPGRAYLLKRKRQELIENATANNIDVYRKLFLEVFQGIGCAIQINPPPPAAAPGRPEGAILNLALLVNRHALQDFFAGVEMLRCEFRGKGFLFDSSGPWPPYNFSKIAEA